MKARVYKSTTGYWIMRDELGNQYPWFYWRSAVDQAIRLPLYRTPRNRINGDRITIPINLEKR